MKNKRLVFVAAILFPFICVWLDSYIVNQVYHANFLLWQNFAWFVTCMLGVVLQIFLLGAMCAAID